MNFPSSPTLNQTYTFEGKTWKWNGQGWQLVPSSSFPWSGLTGVPAEFPPEAHAHEISDVTGLQTALNGKAASSHSHAISNVTGLQTALDGKAPSASPTFTGRMYANGALEHNVVAVGAGTTIDCSLGTYFTKSMSGAWTPTISNVPASRAFGFVVELAWTAGALTLPSGWSWAGGTAPTLSAGTWLLTWITSNGGSNGVVAAQKRGA